ncbi:hypothetical protein FBU30_001096 [Linnemannia zychae]|nr:hypothetical protein FBU30_001096 [Linnemannia zychae]
MPKVFSTGQQSQDFKKTGNHLTKIKFPEVSNNHKGTTMPASPTSNRGHNRENRSIEEDAAVNSKKSHRTHKTEDDFFPSVTSKKWKGSTNNAAIWRIISGRAAADIDSKLGPEITPIGKKNGSTASSNVSVTTAVGTKTTSHLESIDLDNNVYHFVEESGNTNDQNNVQTENPRDSTKQCKTDPKKRNYGNSGLRCPEELTTLFDDALEKHWIAARGVIHY